MSQVADGTGDIWTYTYDTAGHLLSVTAPGPTAAGLTTTYTYDTGSNPETANALLSITNPDRFAAELHLRSPWAGSAAPAPTAARTRSPTPTRARPRSRPPTAPATRPSSGTTTSACRPASRDPAGRHFHLPLRQQRQPGQLHRRGRRHLPVHLRLQRQPDADRQPARPDRAA